MIARGVEQRGEMVLHDAIEHGVFRLAAGITTRCRRGGVGVVDRKHGWRAEQVPCHVPVQTTSMGWKRDLPGGVRRLDVPPLKCPDPGQDISARSSSFFLVARRRRPTRASWRRSLTCAPRPRPTSVMSRSPCGRLRKQKI